MKKIESVLVWSDEEGDLRKKRPLSEKEQEVIESALFLEIRRVTSKKGRCCLEISNLPKNKAWCKKLAKDLKVALAAGGAYKGEFIEIHGDLLDKLSIFLDKRSLRWKKIGG